MSCIIVGCTRAGTKEITDALQYPEKYNGKLLCDEHFADREYMKENDSVS